MNLISVVLKHNDIDITNYMIKDSFKCIQRLHNADIFEFDVLIDNVKVKQGDVCQVISESKVMMHGIVTDLTVKSYYDKHLNIDDCMVFVHSVKCVGPQSK